jgi:hypothetical protein
MEPEGSYRVHKSPPMVPILSQIKSVSKIHFNIILQPMSRVFLVVSFLLAFPPKS